MRRPLSLRGRLVATLVAVAAVGMLALGLVTYASQRDYLYRRVDDQTRTAQRVMGDKLDGFDHGPGRGFGGGGPTPPDVGLPSGTYGVRLTASGAPIGTGMVSSYGEVTSVAASAGRPKIPSGVRDGTLTTVRATKGTTRYRLRVDRDRAGTGLIAVAVPLTETDQNLRRLLVVILLVIGGILVLLGMLSWVIVRVELRPLARIGRTADAIAAGELSKRVEATSPHTEVGRLGVALNAMLDRLEKAFAEREASEERLRTFLADASHELRTPLASIRGYAELFSIGAVREHDDVAKAMRRIEEESTRMGTLVEELLALARLDETRDHVSEPVDLCGLVDDAAADARAIDPSRSITATHPDEDDVVVLGDADQLRQVLANLMRNALVHTPPDAAIEIAVRAAGQGAEVVVRDHGPGLPTSRPEELFERFWRAEGGRVRGRAGAGLGLAIVDAIVRAHGGTVTAANAPGGGACFTVALPSRLSATSQPSPALR